MANMLKRCERFYLLTILTTLHRRRVALKNVLMTRETTDQCCTEEHLDVPPDNQIQDRKIVTIAAREMPATHPRRGASEERVDGAL